MSANQEKLTPTETYLNSHGYQIPLDRIYPEGDLIAVMENPDLNAPELGVSFNAFLTSGTRQRGVVEGSNQVRLYNNALKPRTIKENPLITEIEFDFPYAYFVGKTRDGKEGIGLDEPSVIRKVYPSHFPFTDFLTRTSEERIWRITSPELTSKIIAAHKALQESGEDSRRV